MVMHATTTATGQRGTREKQYLKERDVGCLYNT